MKKKQRKLNAHHEKMSKDANFILSDKDFLEQVQRLAEPVCEAEGLELIHAEYQMEPAGKTLRLYIDKPIGITIDDCVAISRQLSDVLDIYIENNESYRLEVSSPGSNRPLAKYDDFNRFKNNLVRIQSSQPVDGQKKFKGTLLGIKNGIVSLSCMKGTVAIKYEDIKKARLINNIGEG